MTCDGARLDGVIRGGLAATALLACLTLAWWLHDMMPLFRSDRPDSGIANVRTMEGPAATDLGAKVRPADGLPPAGVPSSPLPEDDAWERVSRNSIKRKLIRQGVPAVELKDLPRQNQMVHPDILERIAKVRHWWPELNKASSSVRLNPAGRPTLLSIDTLDGDSILWELGLRERDVIVLINGDITPFDPAYAASYVREAQRTFAALERGESASVTVLRGGRPIELVYEYW